MITEIELISLTASIKHIWSDAKRLNHRTLLTIIGEHREDILKRLFCRTDDLTLKGPVGDVVSIGVNSNRHPFHNLWPTVPHVDLKWSHSKVRLGGTEAILLIDLSEGCDPDTLAANLGTICGGGLIIILMPRHPPQQGALKNKLSVWPHQSTAVGHSFWGRIWHSLQDDSHFNQLHSDIWMTKVSKVADESEEWLKGHRPTKTDGISDSLHELISQAVLNYEQYQAIIDIIISHERKAFTAVSLTANRGRGKSSVLGIAAASLLLRSEREIYVTAPSEYACEAVFKQAFNFLKRSGHHPIQEAGTLTSTIGHIRFVTPRELWTRSVKARVLFVDEAAALPVPFLDRLLEQKPSLVFATTTHGYEGTGRGFSLRFRPILQRKLRKLYEPTLKRPVRWNDNDPIESWSMRVMLLAPKLVPNAVIKLAESAVEYECINPKKLATMPELYEQVFTLLINAHYRTKPSDLWRLLDAPNLSLHILYQRSSAHPLIGKLILAAAIVSKEGNLPTELSASLYEGRHRPRGQLFAANFAIHLNCEEGATLNLSRIVRIATLPLIQGQGLGTRLLKEIREKAIIDGVDIFGSSFGATHQLSRFWSQSGFKPLRISVRQSHVSGERSLLVAQGLSKRGKYLIANIIPELYHDFNDQLIGAARDLNTELVFHISTTLSKEIKTHSLPLGESVLDLTNRQWKALGAVAFSGRAYELAAGPAKQVALYWLSRQTHRSQESDPLTPLSQLLIMKVVQGQRWMEVTHNLGVGSTSEVMKGLSAALRLLYLQLAPLWAKEWVKRFPQYDHPSTLCHALLPNRLATQGDPKKR